MDLAGGSAWPPILGFAHPRAMLCGRCRAPGNRIRSVLREAAGWAVAVARVQLTRAALPGGRAELAVGRMVPATRGLCLCWGQRPGGVLATGDWSWKKVWSMTGLAHREHAGFSPDLFAWLEGPFLAARPVAAQAMRMEEYVANGRYVVRAELPGVDPAKDMEVSVAKGHLDHSRGAA